MRFGLRWVPNGEAGTDETVREIASLALRSLRRPFVRLLAIQILDRANLTSRQPLRATKAFYDWVRERIRYVFDPLEVETVQDPETTTRVKAGDCDDHACLLAALGMSVGIPVRYVVLGNNRNDFQHIYVEFLVQGRWYPVDTVISKAFGTAATLPVKKIYSEKGEPQMGLGAATQAVPLKVEDVQRIAYNAFLKQLKSNWNRGVIGLGDIQGYLRIIDEGDSPSHGTVLEASLRRAIQAFYDTVVAHGSIPSGQLAGMGNLRGLLNDIWNAGKKAVGVAVDFITGTQVSVQTPSIQIPSGVITTTVSPEAATAAAKGGIQEIFQSPVFLIGGAAMLLVLLWRGSEKGRR